MLLMAGLEKRVMSHLKSDIVLITRERMRRDDSINQVVRLLRLLLLVVLQKGKKIPSMKIHDRYTLKSLFCPFCPLVMQMNAKRATSLELLDPILHIRLDEEETLFSFLVTDHGVLEMIDNG